MDYKTITQFYRGSDASAQSNIILKYALNRSVLCFSNSVETGLLLIQSWLIRTDGPKMHFIISIIYILKTPMGTEYINNCNVCILRNCVVIMPKPCFNFCIS